MNSVIVAVSVMLVSFGWCEPFAGENINLPFVTVPLRKWKQAISRCRDKTNFVLCPIKVGIFFLLAYFLVPDVTFSLPVPVTYTYSNQSIANSTETRLEAVPVYGSFFTRYSLMLVQISCGYACNYLCGIACKIHMQRFSFCLPLILVPLLAISLTIWRCLGGEASLPFWEGTIACPASVTFAGLGEVIGVAIALQVSIVLLSWHVWFPSTERMAKLERYVFFCAMLFFFLSEINWCMLSYLLHFFDSVYMYI